MTFAANSGNEIVFVDQDIPYLHSVTLGKQVAAGRVAALGRSTIATTGSVPVDMWEGAAAYPFMTAATSLELVSDNANDSAAGTGGRSVLVSGLNASFAQISETVIPNGTTAVALTQQFYRINSLILTSAGSGKVNAGQIVIRDAGAGTTRAIMTAGIGISRQAVYTVPAGYTLLLENVEMQINSSSGGGLSRGADCVLYFGSPNGFYRLPRTISCTDLTPYVLRAKMTIPVAEKFDFMMRTTYTSANAMTVSGAFEGALYRR